jgi:predicted lipoprotein with Yx(FWY)xxD motif
VRATLAAVLVLLAACGSPHRGISASRAATGGTVAGGSSDSTSAAPASPPPSHSPSSTTPRPSRTASGGATQAVTIASGPSQYGTVLFDRSGQAVYTFGADQTGGAPTCYADCARAWPPVLTLGRPIAGPGVRQDLLSVTIRRDGTTQASYAGKPLYFYAADGKHEVLCHNVVEFGGLWLAVSPAGTPAPT